MGLCMKQAFLGCEQRKACPRRDERAFQPCCQQTDRTIDGSLNKDRSVGATAKNQRPLGVLEVLTSWLDDSVVKCMSISRLTTILRGLRGGASGFPLIPAAIWLEVECSRLMSCFYGRITSSTRSAKIADRHPGLAQRK